MSIDWVMLRAQKATLQRLSRMQILGVGTKQNLEGIINLLDAIQDCAVDTKEATEVEVFGELEG